MAFIRLPKKRGMNLFILVIIAFMVGIAPLPKVTEAAVTKVICIPWQGDISKYHTTWSGLSVMLKGVIKTDNTNMIWYKWNFGDGTESTPTSLTGKTKYNVEITHAYTGAKETPFTAKLIVADNNALINPIEDPYLIQIQEQNLDAKINVAIDIGLWYLYKSQYTSSSAKTFDGSTVTLWSYGGYFASPTASAVHAFEINGHKETGDPNQDPYAESVEYGLNWLFQGYWSSTTYPMLQSSTISPQHGDNPDSNSNGIGIEVRDYGYRPVYEGGMVMDAIIASGTPNADTGRDFDMDGANDTYGEVLQDMVDMYAFGQYDGTVAPYGIIGGWRYNWNQWPDNSACQWAAIGMIPAEQPPWNCTVPNWVKQLNDNWLKYSHSNPFSGHPEWGGFGYTSPSWGYALTPSGMVQLAFSGATTSDPRWIDTERWIADNWASGSKWLTNNNVYAYYAFAKAMRLAKPAPVDNFSINNFPWYRGDGITMGLAENIVNRLIKDGYWDYYGPVLGTSWCVIILRPVLFHAAPIACFDADPNPNYADKPINFDPSCSDHSEGGKDINNLTLFEWDWDNDGVYDASTTTPSDVTHSFSCPTVPCTYPVTLRVTDDNTPPRTATYVVNIQITNPPHPPVADANGPYMVSLCTNDTLTLDGSNSYDTNEGTHEAGCTTCPDDTITAWDWDLYGAPFDYTDASGKTVIANYTSPGKYDVGLKVTDNSKNAYPTYGKNLTDEDFTTVDVYNGCICDIQATVGCYWVTLSWNNIGADRYFIYKSTDSETTGFEETANTTETSKTMGSLVMGATTYYRVMAITGNNKCLSKAIAVYADPNLCKPTADAGGPYTGCVDQPGTLDASASTAQVGQIVAWDWDTDGDGQYDDAFGETVQVIWDTKGIFNIGLRVTSSDSLILTDTDQTTADITLCALCINDLTARPKTGKVQLVWTHISGVDRYDIYRGTASGGPYTKIDETTSTYSTYLDSNVVNGTTYYYIVKRILGSNSCDSNEASATPTRRK